MGTLVGHILPGVGFLLVGLWHLTSMLRLYTSNPWRFESRTWFPAWDKGGGRNRMRYLELYLISFGATLSIAWELFLGPRKHQPLDDHWGIPPEHLNNFEHASISLFFLIYAMVAVYTDWRRVALPQGMLHLLAGLLLSQELLLFHLHSSDHMGVEGHYHWLLQLAIMAGLGAVLLEVKLPQLFVLSLARAMSVTLQGVWFIQMGLVLWVPRFTPRGCAMVTEEGDHHIVRCVDDHSTMRAKALANLQFTWWVAGITVFTVVLYSWMMSYYSDHSDPDLQTGRKYQRLDRLELPQHQDPDPELGHPASISHPLSPADSSHMTPRETESFSLHMETGR